MRRDPSAWLEDVLTEGKDAIEFLEGKSEQDYAEDKRLRTMVERKLFVVGEAVVKLRTHFPQVAEALPDVREIVGFRNLLAHGYFALDPRRVFDIATSSLPDLLAQVEAVLERTDQSQEG